MSVSKVNTDNDSVVILGLGNPHYSDSGIGVRVAEEVATWSIPGVLSQSVRHLTPELCKVLAPADLAIVVSASQINKLHGVTVQSIIAPALNCLEATHRTLRITSDPRSLIALTNAKFGQYPQTFWMKVPAEDFSLDHCLSPITEQGLDTALSKIKSIIRVYEQLRTA